MAGAPSVRTHTDFSIINLAPQHDSDTFSMTPTAFVVVSNYEQNKSFSLTSPSLTQRTKALS